LFGTARLIIWHPNLFEHLCMSYAESLSGECAPLSRLRRGCGPKVNLSLICLVTLCVWHLFCQKGKCMSFADLLTLVANQISCRSSIWLHDAVGSHLPDMYLYNCTTQIFLTTAYKWTSPQFLF
jgi:hypothetical protein